MRIIKQIGFAGAISILISATSALQMATHADDSAQKSLNLALEQANKNKADPLVAGQYLHDAFDIAFQMGEYSLAKKLLGASVSEGVELALWDNVALAEIFAREGDFVKAKGRLDYVIQGFMKAKCKYDPDWNEFSSALGGDSKEKVNTILASQDTPILIQPHPTKGAYHKVGDVKFASLDKSLPKELSVNLVIDDEGKVQCISVDNKYKKFKKMLGALKKRKFNPAEVNGKPVWQYGKSYIIKHTKNGNMVVEQIRNAGQTRPHIPTVLGRQ